MSGLYRYTAKGPSGRTERGSLEATSRADALARLNGRRLTPLSLTPAAQGPRPAVGKLNDVGARDLARTLAQLIRSGLSLAQALRFARDELQGPAAAAAQRLSEATDRGEPPSRALAGFSGAEARLLSGVMLAGETSGNLAEALEMAAATFARAAETRARIATSMIYPAFVIAATMATLATFVFFVVPTMAGAFEGSEMKLPDSTRRLLATSAWLKAHGLELALGVAATGFLVWSNAWARRMAGLGVEIALASPAGFGIAPRLDFAAFARLAALSLDAGVPAVAAFETAAMGVRGELLGRSLKSATLAMRLGERPSEAIERSAHPPRSLVRLMQAGEETGDLGAALRQSADLLAGEAELRIQRLGAVAGPVITMALGGLVASVVLSLFLGLLAMSDLASA
jgi:general secretion pathway protein F